MGFQLILKLITLLVLNVGGSCLALGSVEDGVSPASTPTSPHSLAPTHHEIWPSEHHRKIWREPAFAPSPAIAFHRYHHRHKKLHHFVPQVQPPTFSQRGSSGPAVPPIYPATQYGMPTISPSWSSLRKKAAASPPSPFLVLPPPPPNEDCTSVSCTQPLTYTPAGSPCACVWPIEVRLRLGISPYTFFPLVTELAKEIATGVNLNTTQARIMGANAAGEQLDKTIVLLNLVPLEHNFDPGTAFSIYEKFWSKRVSISTSHFGAYEVLSVHYPGLPPSPPALPSNVDATLDQPYSGNDKKGMPFKPIGVDIPRSRRENNNKANRRITAVVILSSLTAFVVFIGALWLLLLRCCSHSHTDKVPHAPTSSQGKPSGLAGSLTVGSRPSSASLSFSSSLMAYTGTAKIYSLSDIERATDNFNPHRILGEGGFGVVYSGILEDGRKVAVKVLKRDDQQGSREFLAEVEMLSRLHHRNLVKLFGICTEEHFRCLVYELVPNGSVESHLHGADKEVAPLNWCARMKIALGAARGLAYLHEDSNPRVIHRDFKASNILLENDFTPKVSDFGLARTALDGHKHISTHVMGTFGYLAPEYAMTGHLLVKSDVYSYGVVLLELLTGRKPVDLLQPPGQENLVAWARPLLTNKEALELIVDPEIINSNIPFDSIVKVAAIASMCVQPEVSHRPFMGEVVQALKLVCNEFEEIREVSSRSCSHDEDFDFETMDARKHSRESVELLEPSGTYYQGSYDSTLDAKIGLSATDLKSTIENLEGLESESFRRQFNSAPLKMGRRRKFWQRLRGLSRGSMSEHGFSSNL